MCIIAFKPAGYPIWDDETIETMFYNNPDGAGVMYAEDGKVQIDKGYMTLEELLDYLYSRDFTDIPLFLHCRIGTSGGNTRLNCHPYPLWKRNSLHTTCEIGFMHNGVLWDYNPPYSSHINDSQNFKNKVLNKLPHNFIPNEGIRILLEKGFGASNRFALLDGNGNYELIGKWIHSNGYMYSNSSYQENSVRKSVTDSKISKLASNDFWKDFDGDQMQLKF